MKNIRMDVIYMAKVQGQSARELISQEFGGLNLQLETAPEVRIAEGIKVAMGGLAVRDQDFSVLSKIQYGDKTFEIGKEYDNVKFINPGQFATDLNGNPHIVKPEQYYASAALFAFNEYGKEQDISRQQDLRDFYYSIVKEAAENGVISSEEKAIDTFESKYGENPYMDNTFDRPPFYIPLDTANDLLDGPSVDGPSVNEPIADDPNR